MAKPPAGSSLLFGALADSGRIKQRKNGSYRMVLDGVDEIDWFTDRPDRVEGTWKPQKLISQWESFFETSEPNAQASFKVGKERELITFEMFKPKFNNKEQRLSFKIDAGIINNRESNFVTGLKGKALDEVTLFIDDASDDAGTYCDLSEIDLSEADLSGHDTWTGVDLSGADLSRTLLNEARLNYADLTDAISLHTRNFSAQSAYQTDADMYLEDKDGVAWDEVTEKLHLRGQLKTEEREDVERAFVNAGFEQMSKTHWIPVKGHPKGGKSLRRYWVRKGLTEKPNTSNTSAWLGRRMGFNDGGSGFSDY